MDSIDIFNTALFRSTYNPRDMLKYIESKIGRDFYARRIDAENKAAAKYPHYNIDQIYEWLPDCSKHYEIQIEHAFIRANPIILAMYKRNPKQYIFISDMYLPSAILERMLDEYGYQNPRVVVSCEHGAMKTDGTLYRKTIELYGPIKRHYDDNYACITAARGLGIEATYSPAPDMVKTSVPELADSFLQRFLVENELSLKSLEYKTGYLFAPVAYAFTRWALSKRPEGRPVFFMARDCYIFEEIARELFGATDLVYAYISRKSAKGPNAKAYLQSIGLQNGDIIIDLGYSGQTQKSLEDAAGIKLRGKYMFIGYLDLGIDRESMMPDLLIVGHNLMALETIFTSPGKRTINYTKKGKPIFARGQWGRNRHVKRILQGVRDGCRKIHNDLSEHITLEDCETIMKRFFLSPTIEECRTFNRINLDLPDMLINYDERRISRGFLFEDHKNSFWKTAYLTMLQAGPYAHLISALSLPTNEIFLDIPAVKEKLGELSKRAEPFGFYGCGTLLKAITDKYPELTVNPAWSLIVDRAEVGSSAYGRKIVKPADCPKDFPLFISILYQNEVYDELHKQGYNVSRLLA
jgi:hypothetical protein